MIGVFFFCRFLSRSLLVAHSKVGKDIRLVRAVRKYAQCSRHATDKFSKNCLFAHSCCNFCELICYMLLYFTAKTLCLSCGLPEQCVCLFANQNINVCAGYSQHKWVSNLSADTDGPSAAPKRHEQEDVGNSGGLEFIVLRLGVDQECMMSGTTHTNRSISTAGRSTSRLRRWKRPTYGCIATGSPLLVYERCSPG